MTEKMYRVVYDGEDDGDHNSLSGAMRGIREAMEKDADLNKDLWSIQEITTIPIEVNVIVNVTVSQKEG